MLKFKTSCAALAYLSSNLLNEVGLSLFRYFEVGLRVCDIVVKKFTFAISSPDEFLLVFWSTYVPYRRKKLTFAISSPDEFLFISVDCVCDVSNKTTSYVWFPIPGSRPARFVNPGSRYCRRPNPGISGLAIFLLISTFHLQNDIFGIKKDLWLKGPIA